MSAIVEVGEAARCFQVAGNFLGAEPFGTGHINDSYRVAFRAGSIDSRYLLQRINTGVFTNPAVLMQNMERVTKHIANLNSDSAENDGRLLTLIPAQDGQSFHIDAHGGCWRMTRFIEGTLALERIDSPQQAFQIAAAFGRFQKQVASLPPPRLNDTIPDFHNTPKRFAVLEKAIESDVANRAHTAKSEFAFAMTRKFLASVLLDTGMPERIAHNDAKSSNVLVSKKSGKGLCVIDLDTVMPGFAVYDFGDMVRSMTSPAAEDERDLSRVSMQFPMFEALLRGYLQSAGDLLTAREKQFIASSGKVITFENGLRFLSDYLDGDRYYKVHREGQNLDRCRAQFKLLESIEEQEDQMNRVVESLG
jgi:hypothetical protein